MTDMDIADTRTGQGNTYLAGTVGIFQRFFIENQFWPTHVVIPSFSWIQTHLFTYVYIHANAMQIYTWQMEQFENRIHYLFLQITMIINESIFSLEFVISMCYYHSIERDADTFDSALSLVFSLNLLRARCFAHAYRFNPFDKEPMPHRKPFMPVTHHLG